MFEKKPNGKLPSRPKTLPELLSEKASIDEQINAQADEALQQAKALLLMLSESKGISLYSLLGLKEPGTDHKKERKAQAVKPKYRDPESDETWTGRGKPPKWMQAKLDAGTPKEAFLIERPE